ncbi:MAG: ABC transporter substrate-binding protein [Synergistaceae bacterium]|nr:ABC transporter substrate-binding protein [Synergistaceae bacterium]
MAKLLGLLLAVCLVLSPAGLAAAQDTVKIAVYGPMTGEHAEQGRSFRVSAELQAEKWNKRGGAGGFKVVVVAFDDRNDAEEAAKIAEQVAGDMDVVGIIGSYTSGVSMAATPVFQKAGLVNISPSASHPNFTKAGKYIFRNNTIINVEGAGTLRAVDRILEAGKIGMLSIMTDWGKATAEIMEGLIERNPNVTLAAHEKCIDGSDDYSAPIANFRAAGVEAVIVVGMHNTFVPFARQYRQQDPNIGLAAFANLYDQQVLDLGGPLVEGTVFPVAYFNESDDPAVIEYRDAYHAVTGRYPSSLAAQSYDAAGIICEAIDDIRGKDRAYIRDYIAKIRYNGVGGEIVFDPEGEAQKVFMILQIQDEKFVYVD